MDKTIEELKEELITLAKKDALQDICELQKSMAELLDRIFHFAFEAGYERGYSDSEKKEK